MANRKSVWCTSLDTCFTMKLQISYSSSEFAEENASACWGWLILRGVRRFATVKLRNAMKCKYRLGRARQDSAATADQDH